MIYWSAPAILAAFYYLLAWIAALRNKFRRRPGATHFPPVSILKPLRGRDPHFYEAIASHAAQDYPEFEILFGAADPADPALADVRRLAAENPQRQISLIIVSSEVPNGKVGLLTELAARARYSVLLVNDSDIVVPPDYLRSVVAPLEDPGVGVVTCLYRARGDSWPARWEALGVATEFVPSVLVARLLGIGEFALGSTMVFRAEQIREIGGFRAVEGYLADDYQLGKRICDLGYRVEFAPTVVETNLGTDTWSQAWQHQLRWARTIRVSRPGGYYGYAVTQATVWALVACLGGAWRAGLAALLLRLLAGLQTGFGVLGDRNTLRYWFLIPLRDLWGFAVWVGGLFGTTVEWRGQKLRLSRNGTIVTPSTSL